MAISLKPSPELIAQSRAWMAEEAFPRWFGPGCAEHGFVEGLSFTGEALSLPRRSIVQGRQLYCLGVAYRLGLMDRSLVLLEMERGTAWLLDHYAQPNGSFAHSVERSGIVVNPEPDLYSQAFVLFGLAQSYALIREPRVKERAVALAQYLERERRAPRGGFTEIREGKVLYQSNPHMHLFEAALAWKSVDDSALWGQLAEEIAELCESHFIESASGALAEHFNQEWRPEREGGRFVLEPGHHFEWSWLFDWHERLGGRSRRVISEKLFHLGEEHGQNASGLVIDELWSDFRPKKESARYWPQCERAKAALRLGQSRSADEAISALFRFLQAPVSGLCFDHFRVDGSPSAQPPKASFLYHVVNALEEYLNLRAGLPG